MGLCKCPKRKVTSLFCREHNVNVCEFCMIESHKQCVIKTFSDWLSDSDVESNCHLCSRPLRDDNCVRLRCLDIYHSACLAEYGFTFPAHTAPAGYRCPNCKNAIIPEMNESSMLALKLREFLGTVNWARPAFGLASLPEFDRKTPVERPQAPTVYEVPPIAHKHHNHHDHIHLDMNNGSVQFGSDIMAPTPRGYAVPPPPSMAMNDASITARRKQELDMEPLLGRNEDENKYERRSHIRGGSISCAGKRKLIYIFGALFILVFLFVLLHSNKENDPLLNPQMDPNMAQVAPEA